MIVYKRKLKLVFPVLVSILGCSLLTPVFAQDSKKIGDGGNGKVVVTIRDKSVFQPSSNFKRIDPNNDYQYYLVFLQRDGSLYEMEYDENIGRYEVRVPEGVYEVILKHLNGDLTRYRRANLYVHSGRTESLFIEAIEGEETVCDEKLGFAALPSHAFKNNLPSIHYDSFVVTPPYKMVIKYCRQRVRVGKTYFKYVYMTYKNLSVYAEKAILDRRTFTYRAIKRAKGKIVTNKGDCIKAGELKINLRSRKQSDFVCRDIRLTSRLRSDRKRRLVRSKSHLVPKE